MIDEYSQRSQDLKTRKKEIDTIYQKFLIKQNDNVLSTILTYKKREFKVI